MEFLERNETTENDLERKQWTLIWNKFSINPLGLLPWIKLDWGPPYSPPCIFWEQVCKSLDSRWGHWCWPHWSCRSFPAPQGSGREPSSHPTRPGNILFYFKSLRALCHFPLKIQFNCVFNAQRRVSRRYFSADTGRGSLTPKFFFEEFQFPNYLLNSRKAK